MSLWNPIEAIGNFLGGDTQEDMVKEGNRQRLAQADRADKRLKALDGIQEQFLGLQQLMNPAMAGILQGNMLAANTAAGGLRAGLNRAGLGNTGLGMSLGAGLQAGATFQTNQLRYRMLQDLLNSAIQTNTARGSFMAGVPIQVPEMSGHAENFQRVGQAIEIVGGMYGKPKNTP